MLSTRESPSVSDYDKKAVSNLRLENAERCLKSASLLLEADDFKSAANRSYYAVFYGIRAILALEGKDFRKHSAVLSYFRRQYIKTGIIDIEYSMIITELFEVRTESDYDDFYIIAKEETENQIKNAGRFLNAVKNYLLSHEM